MKKLGFLFVCLMMFSYNIYALEIKIAFEDKEQPPYYMGNTSKVLMDKPGVSVEMIKLLEKEIPDLKIVFTRYPWKRCLYNLQKNKIDGIFNASYKKSRLEYGAYPTKNLKIDGPVDTSKRITTIAYSLYALKDANLGWNGKNYDVLTGKIGAPLGYSIVGDLKKLGLTVEESNSTDSNLKKIAKKRIVAAALQNVTGDALLTQNQKLFYNIERLSPPLKTKPYYLMLSHKFVSEHPKLAQTIWRKIAEIREKRFNQIAVKYSH